MTRETTRELAENIAEMRAYIQANKAGLTVDSAKAELESPKMHYFHYNRA